MTPDSEDIWRKLRALKPAYARWGIKRLRVFGSVGRGEAGPESDVDLIADFDVTPGLRFFSIERELGEAMNRPVDLFTEKSVDRYLRDRIIAEAKDVE